MEKHGRHGLSARLKQRWCGLVVLVVLLATIPSAPFVAATPTPAGLSPADWQAIQAQIPLFQTGYVKAFNPGVDDEFGSSVAVDGDTAVVGAYLEDGSSSGVNATYDENAPQAGAAYIFIRRNGIWGPQATLKASNPGAGDQFGGSVAISGNLIVVGASQEDSLTMGVNSSPNEAAPQAGAAYVFVRSGAVWSQDAYLKAANPGAGDQFGISVAISGNSIVVGAPAEASSSSGVNASPNEAAPSAGAAYVFDRSSQGGALWTQQAYLKASNPEAFDAFGVSVAISGNRIVVGAYREKSSTSGVNSIPNEAASNAGAAYVFARTGAVWSQDAYLKASNPGVDDLFGSSVAVSGILLVVGASGEDSSSSGVNSIPNEAASQAGAAYVFIRGSTAWRQQAYLKASNPGVDDLFGLSVAMRGGTVVVGSRSEDSSSGINVTPNEGSSNAGAAYVFGFSGTTLTWIQQTYLKASIAGSGDYFGTSVAVSGDTILIGAIGEDGSNSGVNAPPNEGASNAGSAYAFAVPTARLYLPQLTR